MKLTSLTIEEFRQFKDFRLDFRWKSPEDLTKHLLQHPQLLSFPSALEQELGIPAFALMGRWREHSQPDES